MLEEAINNFWRQLNFDLKVENAGKLGRHDFFIVCGMGGSHLGADLVKAGLPDLPIQIHHDYGLPAFPRKKFRNPLVIASSYSGNTEETLDAFRAARKRNLPAAAIAVRGKLLRAAKKAGTPFIRLPDMKIEPRSAVGLGALAILALAGERKAIRDLRTLSSIIRKSGSKLKSRGREIAARLGDSIPVIYGSEQNLALALNWKIRLNETAKIPAFWNTLPEANHNELIGFEPAKNSREAIRKFYFIFLEDRGDHERTRLRFRILKKLYRKWRLNFQTVPVEGKTRWEKIFSSIITADWTAYYGALWRGRNPEEVAAVEKFKAMLKGGNR